MTNQNSRLSVFDYPALVRAADNTGARAARRAGYVGRDWGVAADSLKIAILRRVLGVKYAQRFYWAGEDDLHAIAVKFRVEYGTDVFELPPEEEVAAWSVDLATGRVQE